MTGIAKTLNTKKVAALLAAFLTIFAMLSVGMTPAYAAAGADIGGTVTESIGGKPIGGVTVTITSATGGSGVTATTTTASPTGTYTFVTPDSQSDWVITFTKTGYTTQTITAVNNATAQTKNAALVTSATAATVSGVVSSINASGVTTVLNGASVTAFADKNSANTWYTTTNASGAYTLSLPAGTYTLRFAYSGTVEQYLGNVSTLAAATNFDLAAGGTTTKNANLTLLGTISGTTNPVATDVTVYKSTGEEVDSDTSDGSGVYSFTSLEPGSYYLKFSKANYVTEWWNDKASFGSATAVTVTSGGTTGSISPTLDANGALTAVVSTSVTATVSGTATEGLTLTASNSAWGTSGAESNYQWFTASTAACNAGQSDIAGAIKSTYVVQAADATKYVCVKITGTKIGFLPSTTITSASGPLATHAFTTTPTPTITGEPTVGQVLTAVPGTWAPTQDRFDYQWYHGGTAIAGATNSTHTVTTASVGYSITVAVTAVKNLYPSTTRTSAGTLLIGNAMSVTPTPTISGTAAVGRTLTAVVGAWTPSNVTFTYQWKRNSTAITGATSSTYTLVAADFNNYISVDVTASLATYTSVTKASATTSAVLDKLTAAPVPTITGNTTVGSVLTVNPGTWAPAPVTLTYQWFRNSVAIPGATATTYTLTTADDLTVITIKVTGTKSGYGDETTTSAALQVGQQFVKSATPTIRGNNWVGQTLSSSIGTWDSGVAFTYQWLRNGVAIAGATGLTYKLTTADVGARITFSTTGTKVGFITKTLTSAQTATILNGRPFTKAATPVITGSLNVGKTLGVNRGFWSPTPTKVTYQWLRNLVPIPGATKSTYKLTAADKGTSIRITITVTRSGYATTSKTSRPSALIK